MGGDGRTVCQATHGLQRRSQVPWGKFASVLVAKTCVEFELSCALCRRGGSSGLITVLRGNPADARSAAVAVIQTWP